MELIDGVLDLFAPRGIEFAVHRGAHERPQNGGNVCGVLGFEFLLGFAGQLSGRLDRVGLATDGRIADLSEVDVPHLPLSRDPSPETGLHLLALEMSHRGEQRCQLGIGHPGEKDQSANITPREHLDQRVGKGIETRGIELLTVDLQHSLNDRKIECVRFLDNPADHFACAASRVDDRITLGRVKLDAPHRGQQGAYHIGHQAQRLVVERLSGLRL